MARFPVPNILPVWRMVLEAKGKQQLFRVRRRGDVRELWDSVERWIYEAKASGLCESFTITLHAMDCNHEDPL